MSLPGEVKKAMRVGKCEEMSRIISMSSYSTWERKECAMVVVVNVTATR